MDINNNSSSDFILSSDDNIMCELSDFIEIPSNGFNCLFKVKRYGQWFVLKTLKEEFRNQTIYRQLLKKEFEIGIQLNHSAIVRYISFEPDTIYGQGILMEYIDGTTLKEFLQTKIDNKIREKIVTELLSVLNYLHHAQLTHRDLKPSNILITNNGNNVKIIDFGLSDGDNYFIFKQAAGTLNYSPPETIDDNNTIDCRTDIYSLGKIIKQIYPSKFNYYHHIARRCTNDNKFKRYSNLDSILRNISRFKSIKTFILYCISFSVILVLEGVIIYNSSYYSEYSSYKEDLRISNYYNERAISIVDSIFVDYDDAINNHLYQYRDELLYQYNITASQAKNKIDEYSSTIDNEKYYNEFYISYADYITIKFNNYIPLIEATPTIWDSYQSGELDAETFKHKSDSIAELISDMN